MGEKGNVAANDPLLALESLPLDTLKGSPETIKAWLDTYLKYREVRELRKATDAAAEAAQAAAATRPEPNSSSGESPSA